MARMIETLYKKWTGLNTQIKPTWEGQTIHLRIKDDLQVLCYVYIKGQEWTHLVTSGHWRQFAGKARIDFQ